MKLDLKKKPNELEKEAFEFNIDPGTVLGAAVGLGVARSIGKKDLESKTKKQTAPSPKPVSYYQDVQNLNKNVQIVFTPLGVLYVLNDGTRELTVDKISVSEMTPTLRARFDARDSAYFKNLMMNKIMSDVNLVERHFAKEFVNRRNALGFGKNASSIEEVADLVNMLEEKTASSGDLFDFLVDIDSFTIQTDLSEYVKLDGFEKCAGFLGDHFKFNGMFDGEAEDKALDKLDNARYLSKQSVVRYLPDRVLFVVDGLVVAQMSTMDMNEEGFKAFKNNDDKFFYNFFSESLGVKKPSFMDLVKEASDIESIQGLFANPVVHAELYFYLLNERIEDWTDLDPEILIESIERNFHLEEPIHPIAVMKIWTLWLVNQEGHVGLKNIQAFEKVVRAINSKTVDFEANERNISLGELLFAMDVLENVTPEEDTYKTMSEGIGEYMVEILAQQNYRLIFIKDTGNADMMKLCKYLDKNVKREILDYMFRGNIDENAKRKEENLFWFESMQAKIILDELYSMEELPHDIGAHIEAKWESLKSIVEVMKEDFETTKTNVSKIVQDNLATTVFLDFQKKKLQEESNKFLGL